LEEVRKVLKTKDLQNAKEAEFVIEPGPKGDTLTNDNISNNLFLVKKESARPTVSLLKAAAPGHLTS
jgi:hypothetical protein